MSRLKLMSIPVATLLIGSLGLPAAWAGASDSPIQFDRIEGQTVHFAPPTKPLKTGLFDLAYTGTLQPGDGSAPYFLFSGNPCETCSTERALYLIRPGAAGTAAPKTTSFVYPGKLFDPKTRALLMDSRAFFGQCLSGNFATRGDIYVLFQNERIDRRHKLQSSVFIAEASSDFLHERLVERGLPALRRTLALVRSKKCKEISGRNRLMPLHPRGLNWRNIREDDVDDDDTQPEGDDTQGDAPALKEAAPPGKPSQ